MEESVFVALLLTGFCGPSTSFPNVFYFIREKMTWDEAEAYCVLKHTGMAQIRNQEKVTAMMNTHAGGYRGKAWIGLFEEIAEWTWLDGKAVTKSRWAHVQTEPDTVDSDVFCVTSSAKEIWNFDNCSKKKHFFCRGHGENYTLSSTALTWNEAKNKCEDEGEVLDNTSEKYVTKHSEFWIGLHRPKIWNWSESGEDNMFTNWQKEQSEDLNGGDRCAAAVLTDGTWTDEHCNATYPFFCGGIYKSRKVQVRLKMKSSANMEDPACSADLKQQLHTALTNLGVTDFKLTWKKLPVKQKQKRDDDLKDA